MKIVSSILTRAAGPALVAGLVVASTAAPAVAAPAAAQTAGSTAFRILGGLVGLQAQAGVANDVKVFKNASGHLILSDTTGIAIGPGCTRVSGSTTQADCGLAGTVTRLAISLGDKDDTLVVDPSVGSSVNAVVDAGTGKDNVTTNGGNDLIDVQDNEGGDRVTCGLGTDTVFSDPGDSIASDCDRRF